jgi:hypothetical protein
MYVSASARVSMTEHFCIIHDAQAEFVSGTGKTLEQAYKRFYGAFSRAGFHLARPTERLVWICFPQQGDFNKYAVQAEGMDLSWLDGYYSTLTNRVAVVQPNTMQLASDPTDGASTSSVRTTLVANAGQSGEVLPMSSGGSGLDRPRLTHELAHQLAFNSGLQNRGVMYPFWVSEGLATNFEFDSATGVGFEGSSIARRKCLAQAHAAGELMPLWQFIVQTSAPADISRSRRCYAQAWAFFRYLLTEHSAALRIYLHRVAALPPGPRGAATLRREFIEAFGSLESLEGSWDAFLDRQVRDQQEQDANQSTP